MIRNRIRTSLSVKLLILLAVIVVAGSGLTLTAVSVISRRQFLSYVQETDRIRAHDLAALFRAYYEDQGSFEGVSDLIRPTVRRSGGDPMARRMREMHGTSMPTMFQMMLPDRVLLVDREGRVIAASLPPGDARDGDAPAEAVPRRFREMGAPVTPFEESTAWVLVGSMIDSAFNPQQARFLHALRTAVLLSALAVAGLAMFLGSAFLAGVTRPLRELTNAARTIAAGDLAVTLPDGGGDEIGALARSFRTMRDSLEEAHTQRDRMFRDIAHELRTPVTLLRGEVEAMLDGVYPIDEQSVRSLQEEIGILDRLVADVRLIASMDGERFVLSREPVDMGALLDRIRTAFSSEAAAAEIVIRTEISGELPTVEADRGRLIQVFSNLVVNTLHHGDRADTVVLAARAVPTGTGAGIEVTVRDNGGGIPPQDLPHVFERLYRVDHARSRSTGGSGLGLAIARDLVEAHGGTISAANHAGGGAVITVWLPLQPDTTDRAASSDRSAGPP